MNQASEFNIINLTITSLFSGNSEDIRFLISEFNIFEDLMASSVSGTILVEDGNNLINNLPIYGNETLEIEFSTPNDANTYKKTFRIYKVESRKLENVRSEVYLLHFCSMENYLNGVQTISKSYTKKLISDMADNIMTEFLVGEFQTLETTKYIQSFIIPNLEPMEALNWLAARANSSSFKGSNYVFYEDRDGYNFCSLELRYKQPAKIAIVQSAPNLLLKDSTVQSLKKDPLDIRIIQEYRFETIADTLGNLNDGMYASRLMVHSILEKKWREYDFDYIKTYSEMEHCEAQNVQNGITSESGSSKLGGTYLNQPLGKLKVCPVEFLKDEVVNTTDDSPRTIEKFKKVADLSITEFEEPDKTSLTGKTKNIPRNTKTVRLSRIDTPPDKEIKRNDITVPSQVWVNPSDVVTDLSFNSKERIERWLLQRQSQMVQINDSVRLVVTIPGTVDVTVGDMIYVDLKAQEPPVNGKVLPDVHYKGNYCILTCRHKISPDAFFTILELGKDSVSAPYPDAE